MPPPATGRHTRWRDVRPLDRIRSIKTKLGALIVASVTAAALVTWLGLRFELGPSRTYPVAMAIALTLTWVLARGMTSPLRQMRDSARAMAAGDYSQQVQATSRDEVGQLATAFNAMAAELQAADQARRDLVANVAHELRTPIAALHAQLENLVDGVSDPSPAMLNSALRQTERLTRLITYLLDLSRLDAGATHLNLEPMDVASFLHECTENIFVAASQRDVMINVVADPPDLVLEGDRDRLEQVLNNLLDNAIRHSPRGSSVTVTASAVGKNVVIDVADEGPGIAESDRERIFARFVSGRTPATGSIPVVTPAGRASTQRATTSGGTGIGLSIVRWAVELHGGDVRVVDSLRGSVIRVTLPAQGPHVLDQDATG